MQKIGNFIVRTVDYIFFGLMVLILISAVFSLSQTIFSGWLQYCAIGATAILLALFVIFGNKIILFFKNTLSWICSISVIKMFIIIFITTALTKIFFVFLLNPDATKHPDMATYQSFAYQLAESGKITESVFSAFMWKYEVIYGLFLSPVVKLFGEDTKVMLTYLSVLFALLSVLLFDIIRPHVGKNKAFAAIMLFNFFPVGLFETQLLIHETALLFFYIMSFWLLLKAMDCKFNIALRVFALLLSALLIAFGNKINQGGTVVIISYCIYTFIFFCKEKQIDIKKIIKLLVAVACYLLCFVLVSNLCVAFVNNTVVMNETERQRVEQIQRNIVPYGWGLYLGANTEQFGIWNQEDAQTYYKYQDMEDEQEAKQYQIELIDSRMQVFKDNPARIPYHLLKKIQCLWGSPLLPLNYGLGNSVNDFILTGAHGIIYKMIWGISQIGYILLCALIIFSHKRHKKGVVDKFYSPVTQFKMMIVGLTFVLFLFEVMPKYVSHMQIILICIGAFCLNNFTINTNKKHFLKED